MLPSKPQSLIVKRSVWSSNLESEFELIRSIIDSYPFISMDTEFPGIVFRPKTGGGAETWHRSPEDHYSVLKSNVNRLNLIQVGVTLSDRDGNLPNLGTLQQFLWEFNFSDFNVKTDLQAPDSIVLLRTQGIDFEENNKSGIKIVRFAELMMSSGLVCNPNVSWITFHGAYDFGYLVKALTHRALPECLADFLLLVRVFFGDRVIDVKHLMKFCSGLYGGLNNVSKKLDVKRVVGKSHQAGSDSLLTMHAFEKIRKVYFDNKDDGLVKFAGVLHGLEV
ncbi:probable CCR4-associated factor 1 homolog 9 [Lotus japonicus]|uniref:probable CCR4-associated factor 1 homolog 9 n=1 Tax=Lotus japonicus TaxID=34305 RepID=UPI00258C4644|nr:probable CCR4-associated factor 1 homolog 9 [Lotus japonicus]XP_057425263.1 probable CCR4-associated factor 1 homolog 9 [Lotus japonicus]